MALLPRSLHASNAVCLGDSWFVKLRTQVMRAMKVSRAGANPVIRVAFICGVDVDPGFYDPWQCFRDFLKYYQTNTEIRRLWLQYVNTPGLRKTHGPFAKVLKLFATLGWEHQLGQSLQLAQGFLLELAWLDMGIAKKLLTHYWQQMMVASVAKRQDFHGLDGIDCSASFFTMKRLDHATSELLNCVRDGTFFLNTVKSKYDPSITQLCDCGQAEDTLEHRALTCPKYRGIRERHRDVQRMWFALPHCLTHHGLVPANLWQDDFWAMLSQLPWGAPAWAGGPPPLGTQQLFTDGSCSDPRQPQFALGAWSVVSADLGVVVTFVGLKIGKIKFRFIQHPG